MAVKMATDIIVHHLQKNLKVEIIKLKQNKPNLQTQYFMSSLTFDIPIYYKVCM